MARPIRTEYQNAVCHITDRGKEHRAICRNDQVRKRVLKRLGEAMGRLGFKVHLCCLMLSYYHLVVQTPRVNFSVEVGRLQTT